MGDDGISAELSELVGIALDYGVASAEQHSYFVPFVVIETASDREVHRIESPWVGRDGDAAMAPAREFIDAHPTALRAVYVWDGSLPVATGRVTSALALGHERGDPHATLFGQPYQYGPDGPFPSDGTPVLSEHEPPLLPAAVNPRALFAPKAAVPTQEPPMSALRARLHAQGLVKNSS